MVALKFYHIQRAIFVNKIESVLITWDSYGVARILLFKTISILTIAIGCRAFGYPLNCSGLISFIYCHTHMCNMNVCLL